MYCTIPRVSSLSSRSLDRSHFIASHIRWKYLVKPEKTHSFRTHRVESAGKKRQ